MSKKSSLKYLLVVLGLLIFYVLFNQFDTSPPEGVYTETDVLALNVEKSNGFFLVLALGEPPDADVHSEEFINEYRRRFEPPFKYEDQRPEKSYRAEIKKFAPYLRKARFVNQYKTDWMTFAAIRKKEIKKLEKELSFLLVRYRKLLAAETVGDFTGPRFWFYDMPLLTVSRLYTALKLVDIRRGRIRYGVKGILAQVRLSKKLIKTARSTAVNAAGKTILQESLKALNSVMNKRGCRPETFELILKELAPIPYDDYGSRNTFISYYLATGRWIEGVIERRSRHGDPEFGKRMKKVARLFLQKQRTKNYYYYYISTCIDYDKRPPFKWESEEVTTENLLKKFFWWLQNPTGKFMFSEDLQFDFQPDITKTHTTKALYDMVRISAELHLKHSYENPVIQTLTGLDSYRLRDPYSGKPYVWDGKKKVLYSVGPNREDDGGYFDPHVHNKADPPDIVIPCKL